MKVGTLPFKEETNLSPDLSGARDGAREDMAREYPKRKGWRAPRRCNRNEPSVQESSQHGYSRVEKRTGGQEPVRDESEIPPGQARSLIPRSFWKIFNGGKDKELNLTGM